MVSDIPFINEDQGCIWWNSHTPVQRASWLLRRRYAKMEIADYDWCELTTAEQYDIIGLRSVEVAQEA